MGLGRPMVTQKWTDYSCQRSDHTDCDPITTGYGSRGCLPRRRAGKLKCFVFLSRPGDALERVFDKSNCVPDGRRSARRCGGTNLNAQDQARESFNATAWRSTQEFLKKITPGVLHPNYTPTAGYAGLFAVDWTCISSHETSRFLRIVGFEVNRRKRFTKPLLYP